MTPDEFIHKWINGCDTASEVMHPREMKRDLEEMMKEARAMGFLILARAAYRHHEESIVAKEV